MHRKQPNLYVQRAGDPRDGCARVRAREILTGKFPKIQKHALLTLEGQVPNFVEFEERLECSLQRDLTKMEHTRMRLGFEAQAAVSLVLELQDLQLTIVRGMLDIPSFSFHRPLIYTPTPQLIMIIAIWV